ncbi:response regulator [Hansschlegelia beijingensis]|uniref:histidine kinase n=1 Tax=Hansschlegelia beijingensis TaxID=1133344 RepID=A0A7W6GF58_9HYPH|nr:response regulator [Hansschlegelia beijingensis]MBB3972950.1 PAS domain S-box-containing protein [Hansschlegelia beijingensis]
MTSMRATFWNDPAASTESGAEAFDLPGSRDVWLKALTDDAPQTVWSAPPSGEHDYFNPHWRRLTGAPDTETGREAWLSRIHPDDRDACAVRWSRSLALGEPFLLEHRLANGDGGWRWFLSRGWPVRDERGAVTRWFCVGDDIDEAARLREAAARQETELERLVAQRTADLAHAYQRVAAEAAGRRHEESARRDINALYAAYVDNTPDGVFVVSIAPDGTIAAETMNRVLERALEVGEGGVQGRRLTEFMPAPMAARLTRKIDECVASGAPLRYEETAEILGVERVFEVMLAPVEALAGATQRVVGSARDLTERREAERQLRQAQKMEAIGQLTGGVAHDFNNLLQVVKGNLDLLAEELAGSMTPKTARRLRDAMAGAARGAKLTRQLLAFSRRQPLTPKPTHVGGLVASMTDLLDRTLGEQVEIEITCDPEPWAALVDPIQLENAVLNLAINGRDAMPDGGKLTISVRNLPAAEGAAERIEIAVADAGAGMPPAVLARVFEPFFSTKPEGRGTGLGLPQVQGFIEQSHGAVEIESEPGKGTVVRLTLPRSEAAPPEEADAVIGADLRGRGERILLLEDDDGVRTAVADLLAALGYEVVAVASTAEAAPLIDSQQAFDLLLSDVVMPGSPKPPELARLALLRRPGLKVLFMSGYAENAIVHQGRVDADVHLIEKPYPKEALALKLRQLLDDRTPHAPQKAAPLRVLLVEDEPLIAMGVADLLESFGHTVTQAHNAAAAKAALANDAGIDLMLTDLGLPDMDGEALAEWSRGLRPRLPILFATGRDDFQAPPLLAATGPVAVVTKPFDGATLRRGLEACVSARF